MGCTGSNAHEPLPDPFPAGMSREKMLKEIFKTADADDTGYLSLAEFQKLHEKHSDPKSKEIMTNVFHMADKDGWLTRADGKLSEAEFVEFNIKMASEESPPASDQVFRRRCIMYMTLAKENNGLKAPMVAPTITPAPPIEKVVEERQFKGHKVPLKVTIVSAKGLRNADWVGKSDPYVVCQLKDKPNSSFQTQIVSDNLNPEWNHEAQVCEYHTGDILSFTVKDSDMLTSDDSLGTASLPTNQFIDNGFDGELKLDNAQKNEQSSLWVKVEVVQPKIIVNIVSAKGLRNADWIGKSDPYCICEVKGKADVMIQTSVVDSDMNPEWNHKEELVGYQIEDDLEFIVKDKDPAKPDDILGRVTLPSERFYPDGSFEGDLVLGETGTEQQASLTLRIIVGDEQTPREEIIERPVVSPEVEIINEDEVKKPSSIFCCAA